MHGPQIIAPNLPPLTFQQRDGMHGAFNMLRGEREGLAIDFQASHGLGQVSVKDLTTAANNKSNVSADSFLTNSGTSTKWVRNAAGIYVEAAAGTVAMEYDAGWYALTEPAATNLLDHSQVDSDWTTGNVTLDIDNAVGPDGLTTAARLTDDATNDAHYAYNTTPGALSLGSTYTTSCFVKPGTGRYISMRALTGVVGRAWVTFDTQLKTFAANANVTGAPGYTEYSTGWFRIWASAVAGADGTDSLLVGLSNVSTAPATDSTFGNAYVGTGSTIFFVGGQVELGTVATSPIPTVAAAVTRATDAINAATSTISFSATVGTVYLKGKTPKAAAAAVLLSLDDGTANERLRITYTGTNLNVVVTDGGVAQATLDLGAVAVNTAFQITFGWEANVFSASLDGGAIVTDTSGTLPTVTTLRLGYSPAGEQGVSRFDKVIYVPRRVADAALPTWRYAA